MNKLLVVDCNTGLVKACLADKSTAVPAVPADELQGGCSSRVRGCHFPPLQTPLSHLRRCRCFAGVAQVAVELLEVGPLPKVEEASLLVRPASLSGTSIPARRRPHRGEKHAIGGTAAAVARRRRFPRCTPRREACSQPCPIACLPNPAGARDGVLRWVEEYAKRLREGQYEVIILPPGPDPVMAPAHAISLFPSKPPVGRPPPK